MNNYERYCPKCGSKLTHAVEDGIFRCSSPSCNYVLTNALVIDIGFKSKGIARALSNLCAYPFRFDQIECSSMEAFIQSLKVPNPADQIYVCSLSGPFTNTIKTVFDDWRITQTVHWKGKEIYRHSNEYRSLIWRAYKELVAQSPVFRMALLKSKEYVLDHSIGCTDPSETLLTPQEYISILNTLRNLPIVEY